MKTKTILIVILSLTIKTSLAQEIPLLQKIDLMLMQGQYEEVIDTCRQIQVYDKVDPEIYFRLGLAYNNILDEDRSLENFYQAYSLDPDNLVYTFMLAKAFYSKEKYKAAEQLLQKLCSIDTLNWAYGSYLTSIYMLHRKYDEAINIYTIFHRKDTTNYTFLDKIGFATLKKGDYGHATDLYTKSLSLNPNNLIAIKNLAYLYSASRQSDTAIIILSRGMKIDSTDMSLYSMRAQLYFAKNYNKKALNDYLTILASGDSSELYLKRAGIGYCNNMQPGVALKYLMKAYKLDSSDYETCSYIGQSHYNLRDMDKSVYYYKRVISILTPVYEQLGLSLSLLAESLQKGGYYKEAIRNLQKAQEITGNPTLLMALANLYDEHLSDSKNAVLYYETYLREIRKGGGSFSGPYLNSIQERIDYLKSEQVTK